MFYNLHLMALNLVIDSENNIQWSVYYLSFTLHHKQLKLRRRSKKKLKLKHLIEVFEMFLYFGVLKKT